MISINAYASESVSSEYIARGHGSTFSSLQWNYGNLKKYFIIDNPSGIEPSILTSPQYFYTADKKTFFKVTGTDLIQLILTRGLNVIYQPDKASAFILAFFNSIKLSIDTNGYYVQGGVYDANRNFLGYALNDIEGCYFEGIDVPSDTPALDIPSYQVNNVKNFNDYFNKDNIPDYINVVCASDTVVTNKFDNSTYDNEKVIEYYDYVSNQGNNVFTIPFTIVNNSISKIDYSNYVPNLSVPENDTVFISTDQTSYNNICTFMELTPEDNNLLFSECVAKYSTFSNRVLKFITRIISIEF